MEYNTKRMEAIFGQYAMGLFETFENYEPLPPGAETWKLLDDGDENASSQAIVKEELNLRSMATRAHNARLEEAKNARMKMFAALLLSMGEGATALVEAEALSTPESKQSYKVRDPAWLLKTARKLFETIAPAGADTISPMDKLLLQRSFAEMKQDTSTPLAVHYKRFTVALQALETANCQVPADDVVAAQFALSLHGGYDALRDDIALKIRNKTAIPGTLPVMFMHARGWEQAATLKPKEHSLTHVLVAPSPPRVETPAKPPGGTHEQWTAFLALQQHNETRTCYACGGAGHVQRMCPNIKNKAADGKKPAGGKGAGTSTSATLRCDKCGMRGHIGENCRRRPRGGKAALIAAIGQDEGGKAAFIAAIGQDDPADSVLIVTDDMPNLYESSDESDNEGSPVTVRAPGTPVSTRPTIFERARYATPTNPNPNPAQDHHADDDSSDGPQAMVAASSDDDEPTAAAAKGAHSCLAAGKRFPPAEVLLDNQSARHIFMNPKLLHGIRAHPQPYSIGGIAASGTALRVVEAGTFADVGTVGVHPDAVANILSQAVVLADGHAVVYQAGADTYQLTTRSGTVYVFKRRNGSAHYSWAAPLPRNMVATVSGNKHGYTAREVQAATAARELQEKIGCSTGALIDMVSHGIQHCATTAHDIRVADAIYGPSICGLKAHQVKHASAPARPGEAHPRLVQLEQTMSVDLMLIEREVFLLGVMKPLDLALVAPLTDKTPKSIAAGLTQFISAGRSRNFDVLQIRTDNESGLVPLITSIGNNGIEVHRCGPGQHCPDIERLIRVVKERVRAHCASLPFVMGRSLLRLCVQYNVRMLNWQARAQSVDRTPPMEKFTGRALDADHDLRCAFGTYVQATTPTTDNSMAPRTQGFIYGVPTGNLTGSVIMYSLQTRGIVTRDQFTAVPMPDVVIALLDKQALADGITRPIVDPGVATEPQPAHVPIPDLLLPTMMAIGGEPQSSAPGSGPGAGVDGADGARGAGVPRAVGAAGATGAGAARGAAASRDVAAASPQRFPTERTTDEMVQAARRRLAEQSSSRSLLVAERDQRLVRELELRKQWHDTDFALHVSVRAAMKERPDEAYPVARGEIEQMLSKNVFHPVHTSGMTHQERKAILRSSMFMKDKFLASGAFEKYKARLVAGGDRQDKSLYENLSSPTAATCSVLTVAAIAAEEGRTVITVDIGGAFLNADISPTGVLVHMRLDPLMTVMVTELDPKYRDYVEADGSVVVQLDKALYGCVEAAALWYDDLTGKLKAGGFEANAYDSCVLNRTGKDGVQITVAMHVDDLLITSASHANIRELEAHLARAYPETTTRTGEVIDYVGMTFDFRTTGQVAVTMQRCTDDILATGGVHTTRPTPASEELFNTRESAATVTAAESAWFRTHVAKVLYLAKRVRPECLTAVAFLTTRAAIADADDIAKLKRLLGYLRGTRERGVVLRIGGRFEVRAFIDASYGVHSASGKSHTGCAVVVGEGGPVYVKSGKQKIVTKSSTEAELVGVSDTASQALHVRNFLEAQGYEIGPAKIYQDNMGSMALIKRGMPGSERSRHIHIRHFWLAERVRNGEAEVEHLGTEHMFANVLTKPVQGAQFVRERHGLTNWA
jgi:hypothetical protein